MLLYAVIFTLFSLSSHSSFTTPFNFHETEPISLKKATYRNYTYSIINGLMRGIGSQFTVQEPSISSSPFTPRLSDLKSHTGSYSFFLECFYYAEDELFSEKDNVHNFCQGIGAIGYAWYTLIHRHVITSVSVTSDREMILQAAIIHACDGIYDEFASKDHLTFYKAVCKLAVRATIASTIFSTSNGILTFKSFKYRYGIFEALLPLVDLIEKTAALRDWNPCNKKRVSRLIKSIMRCVIYSIKANDFFNAND